jgi:tRNA modification GTPase
MYNGDTIAAIATPPGAGGVGIVRISGPSAAAIAEAVLGRLPPPRYATLLPFLGPDSEVLDQGIALFFPSPHSFTGEDVLELQGHGGPVVLDRLLQCVLALGSRPARPGEFSERAFLNGKLDLAQAEAISDLIESATDSAARLANRTLQGEFSHRVNALLDRIIALRAYVEAALDFPDEEVDFLSDSKVTEDLRSVIDALDRVRQSARQGQLLRDGMTVVIAGRPNAGKSSLLNALAGRDAAIVTHVPGTTRDLLCERIQIDGMPLHIVDTAGLREGPDPVEREGIRRARREMEQADRLLWVFDDQEDPDHDAMDRASLPRNVPITLVRNKIDLTGTSSGMRRTPDGVEVAIAAGTGEGMDELRAHMKASVGYQGPGEGEFMARRRHLEALERTASHLQQGQQALVADAAGELLAEELRLAQSALSEITGEFLPDDLLGEIFGRFCIGK